MSINPRKPSHIHIFLHTHSHSFGTHNSYDFKHTCMNIFITKMQHTPNIYMQTYSTNKSLGASDRDMQRGTTIVFEFNILNLRGLLRNRLREKRTILFWRSNIDLIPKIHHKTHVKNWKFKSLSTWLINVCFSYFFVWVLQG